MQNLLDKYESAKFREQQRNPQEKLISFETDMADDLHSIALDM